LIFAFIDAFAGCCDTDTPYRRQRKTLDSDFVKPDSQLIVKPLCTNL
jgi:hypothetical protein